MTHHARALIRDNDMEVAGPEIPLLRRPCIDCPFRKDHLPYQTSIQAHVNALWVSHPDISPICHQVLNGLKARPEPHLCAGAILLSRRMGMDKRPGEHVSGSDMVFDTLDDLEAASCDSDLQAMRRWMSIRGVEASPELTTPRQLYNYYKKQTE